MRVNILFWPRAHENPDVGSEKKKKKPFLTSHILFIRKCFNI